ncbi:MAG TPA: hypothetical protein VF221_11030 [Chloroflexota bacterium]
MKANKSTITRLFQKLGLEALPAHVFTANDRASSARLADLFGTEVPLVVRTAASNETRNLPRLVGRTAADASGWISTLPHDLDVIVQPFDEVLFSVEVGIYDQGELFELIPGIWELDSRATPATVSIDRRAGTVKTTWPVEEQPVKWYCLPLGYHAAEAKIEDWQLRVTIDWIRHNRAALDTIAELYGQPCGLKVHYAQHYGLSPQNVRTGLPDRIGPADPKPHNHAIITELDQKIPKEESLTLDVGIAREDHARLALLIQRIRAQGVRTVWLRSGVLSHLAIMLREAGLETRSVQ